MGTRRRAGDGEKRGKRDTGLKGKQRGKSFGAANAVSTLGKGA